MKKFVVIGLGNFGLTLAVKLIENNCEVLGIDSHHETVNRAKDIITHVVAGDAANRSVLETLPIRDFDAAVVSIGQEMAASILISLYLKEMGIKKIIVRAISEDHEKILRMQGVSDIIFPERDMAVRIGSILSRKNVLDYLPLSGDYVIMDVTPPPSYVGKTIRDLQIGARYSCQILGIKFNSSEDSVPSGAAEETTETKIAPSAGFVIPKDSVMIVLGRQADIDRLQKEG